MKSNLRLSLSLCLCLSLSLSLAQTVSDLHFLSGTWKTHHAWGDMTELWSEVEGNNLMCTYRCIADGKVVFYEWIIIEQSSNGPVMILRHFNPGSIGWEEKEYPHTYQLIASTANSCTFESADKKTRISYVRTSPTTLITYLDHTDKQGNMERETFEYTLTK